MTGRGVTSLCEQPLDLQRSSMVGLGGGGRLEGIDSAHCGLVVGADAGAEPEFECDRVAEGDPAVGNQRGDALKGAEVVGVARVEGESFCQGGCGDEEIDVVAPGVSACHLLRSVVASVTL